MIGLVLEGGAMRGMYTCGLLDLFLDENINFDGIMGVSAGALFGVNFLSKQRGRAIYYNKTYNSNKDYMGIGQFLKTGNIVNTEFAYERVPRELVPFDDDTYMNSGVPFYAVTTNLDTGKPEYMLIDSCFGKMDALRASGSMPFVSQPVLINGERYLDGGVSDSIPFNKMLEMGYDQLVVILTRDITYVKKPMNKALINLFYHNNKAFAQALVHRHEIYNDSIKELLELEKQGKVYIIRPSSPLEIGRIESDPEILQSVYDLGMDDGKKIMSELKAFMFE